MSPHQALAVQRLTDHFSAQPGIIGVLLVGALARGFATADSEIELLIVVSDAEHRERRRTGTARFFGQELPGAPGLRFDGGITSLAYLDEVDEHGSEPARAVFQDARVLFSRDPSLLNRVRGIARYPAREREARLRRFAAQFEAWERIAGQALDDRNLTLLRAAVAKLVLFGGRIVLAHNQALYPSHRWFLRALTTVPQQPPGLVAQIEALALDPTRERIDEFAAAIRAFRPWPVTEATWPAQFQADAEDTWLHHPPAIEEI